MSKNHMWYLDTPLSEMTEGDILRLAVGALCSIMPLCEMKEDYVKHTKGIPIEEYEKNIGLTDRCQKSIDYITNILDELNLK